MSSNLRPIRQGDVLLVPVACRTAGEKLDHLTLALGEVTGHSHRITSGSAVMWRDGANRFLVVSDTATLTHEEHAALDIPAGTWQVLIQREYTPEGWQYVAD